MLYSGYKSGFAEACGVTTSKIKIPDVPGLRDELDREYETASQVQLCKYALMLAAHILELINYTGRDTGTIKEGFLINEQWQKGNARLYDVRQISFKIHQAAKASEDIIVSSALRVAGHAVAAGHMRQHAMVASDYAVKVISLLQPDSIEAVKEERLWQINHLKEVKKANE